MFLRFGLDPRVLLPLLMLGGLTTSLAFSARPGPRLGLGFDRALSSKSAERLPALFDPGSSLLPHRAPAPPNPWFDPGRMVPSSLPWPDA